MEEGGKRLFALDGGMRVHAPADAPEGARLVFRPQHASVAPAGSGGALSGEIVHREFLGSTVRYAVRVGGTDVTIDAPFVTGDDLFNEGERVDVTLPSERTLWLAQ